MVTGQGIAVTGQHIRQFRLATGQKQAAIAYILGIDQATLSRWERSNSRICPQLASSIPEFKSYYAHQSSFDIDPGFVPLDGKWPSLIRYYRHTRGLSRENLAEKLDVGSLSIYRWENGLFQPNLSQQQTLRDMIFQPLESSGRYARIQKRVEESHTPMALLMGSLILRGSKPLKQLNQKHHHNIKVFSSIENIYDGRIETWMEARDRAGFFKGEVAQIFGRYRLADNDVRMISTYPLPLENGSILTITFHRPLDPSIQYPDENQFTIVHNDELVA